MLGPPSCTKRPGFQPNLPAPRLLVHTCSAPHHLLPSWSLQDRAYYDRKDPGHNLLPDALQQLPAGLTALELNSFCTVAVPAALARFTRLQRLALTGNSRDVAWADPAAAALMPLLRDVRLDYCSRAQVPACWGGNFVILPTLPDSDASALAAASRLESLHLTVHRWSDNVLELCEVLPALRQLRCVGAGGRDNGGNSGRFRAATMGLAFTWHDAGDVLC